MQIILSDEECEIIHKAMIFSGTRILLNMSSGKDKDTEERNDKELEALNDLIKRFVPYTKGTE